MEFKPEEISKLQSIFAELGFKPKIKWYRMRHKLSWQDITVTIDNIKGFGYVLELEILTDEEEDLTLKKLREALILFNITEASKEEERKRFSYYAAHWEELTKE